MTKSRQSHYQNLERPFDSGQGKNLWSEWRCLFSGARSGYFKRPYLKLLSPTKSYLFSLFVADKNQPAREQRNVKDERNSPYRVLGYH